jgi:hypothetical protein
MSSKWSRVLSQKAADTDNVAQPAISAHRRLGGDKTSTPTTGLGKQSKLAAVSTATINGSQPEAANVVPSSSDVIDANGMGHSAEIDNNERSMSFSLCSKILFNVF